METSLVCQSVLPSLYLLPFLVCWKYVSTLICKGFMFSRVPKLRCYLDEPLSISNSSQHLHSFGYLQSVCYWHTLHFGQSFLWALYLWQTSYMQRKGKYHWRESEMFYFIEKFGYTLYFSYPQISNKQEACVVKMNRL